MASSVEVPTEVMSALLTGFVAGEAARTLHQIDSRRDRPRLLYPGDPFGRVFAWAWEQDRTMAMILLADYLAELRVQGPAAPKVDPPLSLEELLNGLRTALPHSFADFDQVAEAARRDVPELYGDPAV